MPLCPKCGHENADPESRFCSRCGSSMRAAGRPMEEPATALGPGEAPVDPVKRRKRRMLAVVAIANMAIMGGVMAFFLNSKGCGYTEGSFASQGKPFGDFTFVPSTCKSGERMNFYGAILLGEGPTDGGILVGEDAMKGKFVKVEIPGSCKPPDYEVCTELFVERERCSIFEASAHKTNTSVNDIQLVDGHLKLECSFPEGGSVKADIKFENCD